VPTPPPSLRRPFVGLAVYSVVLCILFSGVLLDWTRFAISKERNTYLLLVPVVAAYLIRTTRRQHAAAKPARSLVPAIVAFAFGLVALGCQSMAAHPLDRLSVQLFALLSFLLAGAFTFLGSKVLRQHVLPISFLLFAVPVPTVFSEQIEIFLQYTSAEAAYWLMSLVGIPMIREGINFRLPNIYIQVAQECSGYNSSFCLFMVSVVAGYLFLNSPVKRAILSFAVIPLAILRNGFRVTTLSALCVYVDPGWIDSDLHHKGGPIFFALSLIPFFLLLWALRKSEIAKDRTKKV
jgi:exosortase C (VPDSG-CTERM-specific)